MNYSVTSGSGWVGTLKVPVTVYVPAMVLLDPAVMSTRLPTDSLTYCVDARSAYDGPDINAVKMNRDNIFMFPYNFSRFYFIMFLI